MGSGVSKACRSAAIIVAAATAFSASAAHAVEDNTCLPFDEMVAALRAEGQHTIVQGDRPAPSGKSVARQAYLYEKIAMAGGEPMTIAAHHALSQRLINEPGFRAELIRKMRRDNPALTEGAAQKSMQQYAEWATLKAKEDPAAAQHPIKELVIYTANDNGTRGYELIGGRIKSGANPTVLCVQGKLANISFHNAFERSIPPAWRLAGSLSSEQIKAEGERRKLTNVTDYNRSLDQGASQGTYPVFKASFIINGQPSNAMLSVRMNPVSGIGASSTVAASGLAWQTDALDGMNYGRFALDQFKRRAQVSALTPGK